MSSLRAVTELGQSLWLNYLRRALIESGELRRMFDEGIRGITVTPSVIEKAITCSNDYDVLLERLGTREKRGPAVHEALLIDDVQRAADILHPVFSESEHTDGFVTLPLNPELAHNAVSMVAEGTRLGGICAAVNRANIMIEIPATLAGIRAVRELIGDGCNVHVTHIFSMNTYEQVAEAYLQGMAEFLETHSVWRLTPASVASVPLGTIDWGVDQALDRLGRPELKGKAGIALAKGLYARSREIFSGQQWRHLADRGAKVQRLLWIDTVPRRFDLPDTFYVDALIGPNTVHALSPATLHAFRDHGTVAPTLTQGVAGARAHLQALKELGIDVEANAQKPQERRLREDARTFQLLVKSVIRKRDDLEEAWQRLEIVPGRHEAAVDRGLAALCDKRVMCRIWEHDASVWNGGDGTTSGQFGWLHVLEPMEANAARLQQAVQTARARGYREAVILAGGGAARVAELFAQTFGQLPHIPGVLAYTPGPHLRLTVLDVSDGEVPWQAVEDHTLADTLFVLSDKSATAEMLPVFQELHRWVGAAVGKDRAGDHFIAIANPGSPLAEAAERYHFRGCFLDHPDIHDGFAALSYSGLFPAALTGAELDHLLDRAARMACNASGCNCPVRGDNVAAQLGTILGVLAGRGHRRPTFITSPFLDSFAAWAEALLTRHLAGDEDDLQPVTSERVMAPEDYGADRLFIFIQMEGDETHQQAVRALQTAGHPLVILHVKEPYELGGLLFTWQMAVAVAAYHLRRNPFRAVAASANVPST